MVSIIYTITIICFRVGNFTRSMVGIYGFRDQFFLELEKVKAINELVWHQWFKYFQVFQIHPVVT